LQRQGDRGFCQGGGRGTLPLPKKKTLIERGIQREKKRWIDKEKAWSPRRRGGRNGKEISDLLALKRKKGIRKTGGGERAGRKFLAWRGGDDEKGKKNLRPGRA